jgi:hypothetical protein
MIMIPMLTLSLSLQLKALRRNRFFVMRVFGYTFSLLYFGAIAVTTYQFVPMEHMLPAIEIGLLYLLAFDLLLRLLFQPLPLEDMTLFLILYRGRRMIYTRFFIATVFHSLNFLCFIVFLIIGLYFVQNHPLAVALLNLVTIGLLFAIEITLALIVKYLFRVFAWLKYALLLLFLLFIVTGVSGIAVPRLSLTTAATLSASAFLGPVFLLPICVSLLVLFRALLIAFPYVLSPANDPGLVRLRLKRHHSLGRFSYMHIQLLQVFRNKRLKTMFWIGVFFLFYSIFFILGQWADFGFAKLMFYLMLNCFLASTVWPFLFSMDSHHFSIMMTTRFGMYAYYRHKIIFLVIHLLIPLLVQVPFFIFGLLDAWLSLSFLLLFLGTGFPMVLVAAILYAKKMDPTKSASMNSEGMSLSLMLSNTLTLVFPLAFYGLLSLFFTGRQPAIIIGAVGSIFFVLFLIKFKSVFSLFVQRKYKLAEQFLV